MHLTVDGKEYVVSFQHDRTLRITVCVVVEEKNVEEEPLVGVATCSLRDNFNRAIGRKLSLARAIAEGFPRERRKAFWVAYWSAREKETGHQWRA